MATAKKKISKTTQPNRVSVIRTEQVPVGDLQPYRQNPRIGDVNAVAKSLHLNGQFKPIVVNIGTKTEYKNEILAGNHSWVAARREIDWEENGERYYKEPWDEILVSFVDVDDDQARKIVLADNKTSDASKYDEGILGEIFKQVDNIAGTGYEAEEVEDIIAALGDIDTDTDVTSTIDFDGIAKGFEGVASGDDRSEREKHADTKAEEDDEEENPRVEKPKKVEDEVALEEVDSEKVDEVAEAQVILELKESNLYLSKNNFWGVPDLDPDRLLEEFPEPIVTWGGNDAEQDDGKTHFLYNYSLGGVKGLPVDRALLSFFTYDEKFVSWWETPAWLTARLMGKGLKMAMVPDFSFYYSDSRTHHLWGAYRAQWLGRFFQDAGLRVVPRLQYDFRDPETLEIALLGIPRDLPTLACSIQNVNEDEPGDKANAAKIIREALDELNPKQFLVYGGNPGWEIFKQTGWKGETIHCMNYAGVRREAGIISKKDGKKGLTKKQRDQLIEKHGGDPKAMDRSKEVPDDEEE